MIWKKLYNKHALKKFFFDHYLENDKQFDCTCNIKVCVQWTKHFWVFLPIHTTIKHLLKSICNHKGNIWNILPVFSSSWSGIEEAGFTKMTGIFFCVEILVCYCYSLIYIISRTEIVWNHRQQDFNSVFPFML